MSNSNSNQEACASNASNASNASSAPGVKAFVMDGVVVFSFNEIDIVSPTRNPISVMKPVGGDCLTESQGHWNLAMSMAVRVPMAILLLFNQRLVAAAVLRSVYRLPAALRLLRLAFYSRSGRKPGSAPICSLRNLR
jgi:hypothetical protein